MNGSPPPAVVEQLKEMVGDPPRERKKPGRKPKARLPLDEFNVDAIRKPAQPGECRQCGMPTTALDLETTKELVRSCRDEIEDKASPTESAFGRIRYLAARFDGFCGLSCYRMGTEGG